MIYAFPSEDKIIKEMLDIVRRNPDLDYKHKEFIVRKMAISNLKCMSVKNRYIVRPKIKELYFPIFEGIK